MIDADHIPDPNWRHPAEVMEPDEEPERGGAIDRDAPPEPERDLIRWIISTHRPAVIGKRMLAFAYCNGMLGKMTKQDMADCFAWSVPGINAYIADVRRAFPNLAPRQRAPKRPRSRAHALPPPPVRNLFERP